MLERMPRARPRRLANIARFAGCALLVVGAAGLTAVLVWRTARGHGESQLIDLKIFRRAGHDVLHGISPYPVPTVDAMRGKPVFVWTVNEPALARTLVESGIDGIISDDPGIIPAGRSALKT